MGGRTKGRSYFICSIWSKRGAHRELVTILCWPSQKLLLLVFQVKWSVAVLISKYYRMFALICFLQQCDLAANIGWAVQCERHWPSKQNRKCIMSDTNSKAKELDSLVAWRVGKTRNDTELCMCSLDQYCYMSCSSCPHTVSHSWLKSKF